LRERPEDVPLLVRRFVQDYSRQHDRAFHGISAEAMQLLVEYPWPGNVRELRNLIESMVVLAPGHEIQPGDLPRQIRDGGNARFLPVHVGPIVRGQEAASGRELEFIVRSLLELKLQVEELRRRMDDARATTAEGWIGDVRDVRDARPLSTPAVAAIEPREQASPPNVVTVAAGTKMADIERAAIEMALKETRGNRRRAAEMLGIGERTLYRKIKEYRMPEQLYTLD
jgi:DNA-binding NtrC family response regulator